MLNWFKYTDIIHLINLVIDNNISHVFMVKYMYFHFTKYRLLKTLVATKNAWCPLL